MIEDDIRFFISEKISTSNNPLETIKIIEECLAELKQMYIWREEDLEGIR